MVRNMNKKIMIGNKKVGYGEPTFIIAEAGINHNGNIELAKKLIDVAADAGADAVKFQTFRTENMVSKMAPMANHQAKNTNSKKSQYEILKDLELSEEEFMELYKYARNKNIIFLSTPFDFESADFLDELDIFAFKISSGDLTNLPFLEYIAEKGKPIILSTGMSTLGEIEEAVEAIKSKGNENLILLHCVSSYPAKIEDINLRAIQTLEQSFKVPVGFSDHTTSTIIPAVAVAMGACIIEKHFTLDKKLPGPDHKASLEPHELKEMIKNIREVEEALGDGIKKPTITEIQNRLKVRRSIVANAYIKKGTIINKKMLSFKRPGSGLSPKYYKEIIGKKSRRDIKKDELIYWWDIE